MNNELLKGLGELKYKPFQSEKYDVTPGFYKWGHDLGHGHLDHCFFQLTSHFRKYRSNKIKARQEELRLESQKYYFNLELHEKKQNVHFHQELCEFIISELTNKWPCIFTITKTEKTFILDCLHTEDQIHFDQQFNLLEFITLDDLNPLDFLDALSFQVQEDLCVMSQIQNESLITLLHLSSPSHWAAADKIGQSFRQIHAPVPHFEKNHKHEEQILKSMFEKGPFVRFIWSFVTDTDLNHHPSLVTQKSIDWSDPNPFYLRIERQTIYGLPSKKNCYFGIGIHFITASELKNDLTSLHQFKKIVNSLSEEALKYKSMFQYKEQFLTWLTDDKNQTHSNKKK